MPESGSRWTSRRAGILLAVLLAVPALGVALFNVASLIATSKARLARIGWEQRLGTREQILLRFPAREANRAALEVERATAALGIDIAPRFQDERHRPAKEAAREHASVKEPLGRFLLEQLQRSRRGPEPPSGKVAAFLNAHEDDLEALRRAIADGESPRWELQLEKLPAAPVPNLLGHIDTQKLLVADAMSRAAAGNSSGALADLDASWRLNEALREDPVQICQLVAIAVARLQAGALRQIRDVPSGWARRLREHDFRASFLTALAVEGWSWTLVDAAELHPLASFGDRLEFKLGKPFFRYGLSAASDDYRRRLQNLSAPNAVCDAGLEAGPSALDVPTPSWSPLSKLISPNFGEVLPRLVRLELDLELTAKLLDLQAARQRGDLSEALAGIDESLVCPQHRWLHEVGPDGSMTIAFSRDLPPSSSGVVLPTRYVLEP